jgi:hypothetical protein
MELAGITLEDLLVRSLGSIMGLLQMTATPEKVNIYFDGGVALGVSGQAPFAIEPLR